MTVWKYFIKNFITWKINWMLSYSKNFKKMPKTFRFDPKKKNDSQSSTQPGLCWFWWKNMQCSFFFEITSTFQFLQKKWVEVASQSSFDCLHHWIQWKICSFSSWDFEKNSVHFWCWNQNIRKNKICWQVKTWQIKNCSSFWSNRWWKRANHTNENNDSPTSWKNFFWMAGCTTCVQKSPPWKKTHSHWFGERKNRWSHLFNKNDAFWCVQMDATLDTCWSRFQTWNNHHPNEKSNTQIFSAHKTKKNWYWDPRKSMSREHFLQETPEKCLLENMERLSMETSLSFLPLQSLVKIIHKNNHWCFDSPFKKSKNKFLINF